MGIVLLPATTEGREGKKVALATGAKKLLKETLAEGPKMPQCKELMAITHLNSRLASL